MKTKQDLPNYFTPEELAERFNVRKSTLGHWRIAGKGPKYVKLGKNILYPVEEVAKWEQEQIRQSTVEEMKK